MGERLSVLSESRVREIRLLGSMKRDVETESWNLDCGTANRKGRKQLRGTYRHRATSRLYVRPKEGAVSSWVRAHPATVAPAGSNRSSRGGDEAAEAFGVEGHVSDLTNTQAIT